jgi:hypothetical protein
VNILKAFAAWHSSCGVLVQLAKVLTEGPLLLNAKVLLVAEENDTSCRDQPCKVVLLKIGEVGEIDTMNLCSNLGVVVEDFCSRGEEVLEVNIAEAALIGVGDLLQCIPVKLRKAWAEVFIFICLVVLCDCCTPWDVVVDVGGLD